ncbi:MAG: molybdopterin molybdotransferase MoeA [Ferruginibacter sp.]
MITVAEAKKIIEENVLPLPAETIRIQDAAGMQLAADVFSATDIPPFNQSSVDGYAFSHKGWEEHKYLKIKGEIPAGYNLPVDYSADTAVRIFTGAPVPAGADTVVMQENTKVINNMLHVEEGLKLLTGSNTRLKGTDIKQGELALEKDSLLSPAAIGFLAGVGIDKVTVYKKPFVTIIVTGDELQQPGEQLSGGQVYESNSYMLLAALQQLDIHAQRIIHCDDTLEQLTKELNAVLPDSDIVLLTGGVSVGDYDFVPQAAEACGVHKLFHKIKQRPGKPLFFGKKRSKLVFGLPGNPSSVLTCFYEYVVPALHLLNNIVKPLEVRKATLSKSFEKPAGLTHFVKAVYDGNSVITLGAQESYRLSSFAKANCLLVIEEDKTVCKEGEVVEIHLLPF